MWWLLHVPSIFANGFCVVWKKKKKKEKNSCELLKYPKARFQKRGVERKKTIRVSSCASSHVSKRRYQPWLHGMRGVRGRLNWTRFSTMVWSPSCYPNTNKQRRNIGVNDRGGGVEACQRAGWAPQSPRAPKPEKWKTGAHYEHFQTQLRTGLSRRCSSRLQTSLPLSTTFHDLLHLCKRPRRESCLHGYMKKFHGLGTLENF